MIFHELIHIRQSVRQYSDKAVEEEKLIRCLEAARLAPSASNSQPWKFIVVNEEPCRTEVARATFSDIYLINRFSLQATVMIAIVLERPRLITRIGMQMKKKDWPLMDIGITAEHFCLQAAEDGLGTCMIGWFDEDRVKKALKIPVEKTVGLLISLGYPKEGYPLRKKNRKPLEDVIRFNRY